MHWTRKPIGAWAQAIALLVTAGVAREASAQKPPTRKLTSMVGHLSTPARRPYDAATVKSLKAPPGFEVSVFADGLGSPRMLAVGDDGTVYVTRRDSSDVLALRDGGNGRASAARKVLTDLHDVHGIAIRGKRVYLATVKEIYAADIGGDGAFATPRAIVTDLPDGGQHPNRTLALGPDGMLYVSIGSTCNACVETNDENATMLRMKTDGSERGVYARGLRNTVGWAWHPETGELWGMDHGMDWRGDTLPPEELNRIQSATNYGWPFCLADRRPDPYFASDPQGSTKDEFCAGTAAPTLTYPAHSAPIGFAFYTGTVFPADYRGDAFVAMRGSWNREPPTGYKVVRIHFEKGQPVRFEDFLTGFLAPGGTSYLARLAGLAIAKDGSLLVADDTNGVIYRVAYVGGK